LAYIATVIFVETPIFYRRIQAHMNDDDYGELQSFMALRPEAGAIIKGSGGIRKLRWRGSGRGKSGGLRVIYFWWVAKDRISLLMVYAKSEQDDLTADQLKKLKKELAQ
jgi:hypothetical protein